MKKTVITTVVAIGFVLSAGSLGAQHRTSPADTGRLKWGHTEFDSYDRASMCDRAMAEVFRLYTRIYKPDTATAPINQSDTTTVVIPAEVGQKARECVQKLDMSKQGPRQLRSLSRMYLEMGDIQQSIDMAKRSSDLYADTDDKFEALSIAVEQYLDNPRPRLAVAHQFYDMVMTASPAHVRTRFDVNVLFADFYYQRYLPDSVQKYSDLAIAELHSMSIEDKDKVEAFGPFVHSLNIANEQGDLKEQDRLLDSARSLLAGWRYGRRGSGSEVLVLLSNILDTRKTLYNKKTKPLEGSFWANNGGVPRPVVGKVNLLVQTSHNCAFRCTSQILALKRLARTFGDQLDISLITMTNGFAPGSGPLTPEEEAKAATKYFTEYHGLPFPILIDESPTHKLPDGRIIRDKAPVASIFANFQGVNALLTDASGKIQWVGSLYSDVDRRIVVAAINRAISQASP